MKVFNKRKNLPEFDKDMKKLKKKYRTLEDDLEIFINSGLKAYHKIGKDNKGISPITGLRIKYPKIYKVTKFACRSLKTKGVRSGIRVIYAYYEDIDKIEFIEIYYKGDKDIEDRERIKRHYGS